MTFLKKMRVSTPFQGASLVLMLLGTMFALSGHCSVDSKTVTASALFILSSLSLGTGLIIFISVLTEAFVEHQQQFKSYTRLSYVSSSSSTNDNLPSYYDYKYGWSFFATCIAFLLVEISVLFTLRAYIKRFPTMDDMARILIPGMERKYRERYIGHQHLLDDDVRRSSSKYSIASTSNRAYETDITEPCPSRRTSNEPPRGNDMPKSMSISADARPKSMDIEHSELVDVHKIHSQQKTIFMPALNVSNDMHQFTTQTIPIRIGDQNQSIADRQKRPTHLRKFETLPNSVKLNPQTMRSQFYNVNSICDDLSNSGSNSTSSSTIGSKSNARALAKPNRTKKVTVGGATTMARNPAFPVAALSMYDTMPSNYTSYNVSTRDFLMFNDNGVV